MSASSASSVTRGFEPTIARQVHDDDIHGLRTFEGSLISGSKDTTVKIFDNLGNFSRLGSRSPKKSYSCWVTALDTFKDGSWIAGHRNGFLISKDFSCENEFYRTKFAPPSALAEASYKPRNESRITGIRCLENISPRDFNALVGFTDSFIELNLTTKEVVRNYFFDEPEWVYGFAEISRNKIAVIHGCSLSVFEEVKESWDFLQPLVKPKPKIGDQKQFISHIQPLDKTPEITRSLATAYFGGVTEVIDTETSQAVFKNREHEGRVWQAVPNTPVTYASCADDRTVKFWDVRQPKSVVTLGGHPGRVSAITFQEENLLVAATCPDNPHESEDKGQFYFYDLKSLS